MTKVRMVYVSIKMLNYRACLRNNIYEGVTVGYSIYMKERDMSVSFEKQVKRLFFLSVLYDDKYGEALQDYLQNRVRPEILRAYEKGKQRGREDRESGKTPLFKRGDVDNQMIGSRRSEEHTSERQSRA